MTWIKTYTGGKFDYTAPTTDDISSIDIAHALSREQRFGGHLATYWSIGQHTLLVRKLVEIHGGNDAQKFIALHHDSAEAYMKDVPTPLKRLLGDYGEIYDRVVSCVEQCFNVKLNPMDELVEDQDKLAAFIEDLLFSKKHNKETKWHNFTQKDYKELVKLSKGTLDIYIRKLLNSSPDKVASLFLNCHFHPKS